MFLMEGSRQMHHLHILCVPGKRLRKALRFDRCIFELGNTNIQVGYPRKQEFHIRYNKQTTMVENNDHLL